MNTPIIKKLKEITDKKNTPFHMPGHKRNKRFIPNDLLRFDITETDGADNLFKPEEIIKESQSLTAALFGAEQSFYLVNGSSCGIIAAILSLCNENDVLLTARNCHKSVYSGLILSGAAPIYVYPDILQNGIIGGISPLEIEKKLNSEPNIKAVLITSPTYEGICSDIKSISEICHKKNIPLIVDEAHGAHFAFSDFFPKTALSLGADIVIQSLHKTLPALTQTAVLHVKSSLVSIKKLKNALSVMQTSSPSYIFMSVADNCQGLLNEKASELFYDYVNRLKLFYNDMSNLKNIQLFEPNISEFSVTDFDRSKLVFVVNSNESTDYISKILLEKYGIYLEMCTNTHFLAMTSVCDTFESFNTLKKALYELDKTLTPKKENKYIHRAYSAAEIFYTPKQASQKATLPVPLLESIGKICGEFVIPYPPGIPLIAPGEVISPNILKEIINIKKNKLYFIGTNDITLDKIEIII